MARKTPTVQDGKLTWPDGNGDSSIAVGSPEWRAWLSNAKTFRFVSGDGTFTACKEHFRSGGWYWRAYLHRSHRIHHAYLGKEDALTYDRLEAIAASLAMRTPGNARSASLAVAGRQQTSSGPLMAHSREAASLLNKVMGLDLSEGEAATNGNDQEILQRSEQINLAASYQYIVMARLLCEGNDLEGAMRQVTKAIEFGRRSDGTVILVFGHMVLARLKQAQGDLQGALDDIAQAESLAGSTTSVRLIPTLAEYRARLWLLQGRLEAVGQWAESAGLHLDDELSHRREAEYMTLAQLKTAQGKPAEAVDLLDRLLRVAESEGRTGRVIKILALRTLALNAADDANGALESLARALSLAEPEGYMRTFIDAGAPMAGLLTRVLDGNQQSKTMGSHSISIAYVRRLLAGFEVKSSEKETEATNMASASAMANGRTPVVARRLIEPLSEREVQVLRLLADGASNQEIAQRTFVVLATAKKHVGNIYGKLAVHSRTQAIARAREMGLLPR